LLNHVPYNEVLTSYRPYQSGFIYFHDLVALLALC
jgi:hypothetical protein